ncbi:hypothetical protein D3C71_1706020 [compost metagenome]
MIPQAGLMEGAYCPRSQPGGDKNDKQAGPFKEAGEVQAHAAPVNQHAQYHRRGETQHRAQRRRIAHVLLKGRQQKEYGFQAFARDGEEYHHHQRPAAAVALL